MIRLTSLTVRLTQEQSCNILPLYIYRSLFKDQRPEPPTILISGYGDSPVADQGSCIAVLLTGCQMPQRTVFQVTETSWYLILGGETVQQIGYIWFLKITPPKLRQPPKTHTHLKAIAAKNTKVLEDKQKGAGSEMAKGTTAWWCSTHKQKEAQLAQC